MPFSARFPHSPDKRAGISKYFLSFSTLFLYIPWKYLVEKNFTWVIMQDYANSLILLLLQNLFEFSVAVALLEPYSELEKILYYSNMG